MAKEINKKEEERIIFYNKIKKFLEKNEKLTKRVLGQFPIQGAKHLILDMIITEATKMRPYLNFIKYKEVVINIARQISEVMKENLYKMSSETTQNTINFLNTLSKEELKKIGMKDRISVIT